MTVVSTFKGSAHKYAVIGVRGEESLAISLVVYPENEVLFLDARFVAFHAYDTKVETMVFNHLKPRQLTQMVIDGTPKIIVRLNHFLIKLFTPAPSRYYLGALCADLAVWDLLPRTLQSPWPTRALRSSSLSRDWPVFSVKTCLARTSQFLLIFTGHPSVFRRVLRRW